LVNPEAAASVQDFMKSLTIGSVVFLSLAAHATAEPVETIERSFDVSGVPVVHVRVEDGRTELSSHAGSRVEIRAFKEVEGASSAEEAERLAREVEVRIERHGDRIEVETRYPQRDWTFWRRARVRVHVEIRAPRRSDLEVSSEDGPVRVTGFEGELRLSTEDGSLSVTDCSGRIRASSEDGSVELRKIAGEVRADVEDGDLWIEGAPSLVIADAEDGDIVLRLEPGTTMAAGWSIHTRDGSIRIEVPPGFAADLDVRVDDGSIRADQPAMSGAISEGELRFELGPGGHRLQIRSQDGSIRLLTAS
jgi:DUF4097 and DUF4098 domain-containing protein YvlB